MFFLTLILQHFILVFTKCFSYFDFTPFYFRFYTFFSLFVQLITRQLSYRKEDRAMRPIDGCPEKS